MMTNIFITGVSSGIGEAITDQCIQKGYRVFGSVRNEADAERCSRRWTSNFTAVIMDVSKTDTVRSGAEQVKQKLGGDRLHILVNNSGIVKSAPLETQSMTDLRAMFEVNVFGLIEVTRAFLPMMRLKKQDNTGMSKVVNISSTAGAIGIPFLGGYVATKHAVEGLSESWRRELMPFGIDVILVSPGNVVTPLWDKAKVETVIGDSPYKDAFKNFYDYSFAQSSKAMKASEIATVVMTAITSSKPKVRYAPVAQKFANWYLPRFLSARTVDSLLFKTMKMKKAYN